MSSDDGNRAYSQYYQYGEQQHVTRPVPPSYPPQPPANLPQSDVYHPLNHPTSYTTHYQHPSPYSGSQYPHYLPPSALPSYQPPPPPPPPPPRISHHTSHINMETVREHEHQQSKVKSGETDVREVKGGRSDGRDRRGGGGSNVRSGGGGSDVRSAGGGSNVSSSGGGSGVRDDGTSNSDRQPTAPVVKAPVMISKRKIGGRTLKTGMVKKSRQDEDEAATKPQDKSGDGWSKYMAEVEKYKQVCTSDDNSSRPLVK